MKAYKAALTIACLIAIVALSSWGFLVHRTVNQLAIYQLPKSMQPFYHSNMEYLVRHSVRPDQRRSSDKEEDTKHFINFEAYGDSAALRMPLAWDAALRRYKRDTLLKYGYVPYWVMEMKTRLTNAFRSGNKDSILFYSADMAHYIADAHVPLHTSTNYDGQLTGQKGLHSLWESAIPEIHLKEYDLYTKHKAKYLQRPERAIWKATREAHLLLNDVFLQEKEASKNLSDSVKYRYQQRNGREVRSYSSAFAREYSKRLGNTINTQLLRSSEMCADFWYTCWVDAGKPDLSKLMANGQTEKEKEKLSEELKAFRRNELIKAKLLLSRQEAPRVEE